MAKKHKPAKPAKAAPATEKKAESSTTVSALVLPNYSLSLLYVLLNVPLHGAQSRSRNRFGQLIKNRINYLEDERISMLEERCNKDGKGEPKKKIVDDQEQYDISDKALAEYRKEFDALMHENTVIDLLPSTKADIAMIRPLVLESKTPIETVDGYTYEEICKAFEAI